MFVTDAVFHFRRNMKHHIYSTGYQLNNYQLNNNPTLNTGIIRYIGKNL